MLPLAAHPHPSGRQPEVYCVGVQGPSVQGDHPQEEGDSAAAHARLAHPAPAASCCAASVALVAAAASGSISPSPPRFLCHPAHLNSSPSSRIIVLSTAPCPMIMPPQLAHATRPRPERQRHTLRLRPRLFVVQKLRTPAHLSQPPAHTVRCRRVTQPTPLCPRPSATLPVLRLQSTSAPVLVSSSVLLA